MSVLQEPQKCQQCPAVLTKKCTGCYLVSYCSTEHQKQDWPDHKHNCKSYEVQNDSKGQFKRYCIATRNLEAGSIILEENALIYFPAREDERLESNIYCLACGIDLDMLGKPDNRCSTCQWPICGIECERREIHAAYECEELKQNPISYDVIASDLCSVQPSLHALENRISQLMKKNPDLCKQILRISIPSDPSKPWVWDKDSDYRDKGQKYSELMRICTTQVYDTRRRPHESNPPRVATFVFLDASDFSHECSPNCTWSVGDYPDYKISIRTAVPVTKGDKLTVSRTMYHELATLGTRHRHRCNLLTFNLVCDCRLCLDPTEFGSYVSAITCKSCYEDCYKKGVGIKGALKFGYLLPEDPKDVSFNGFWVCSRCKTRKVITDLHLRIIELANKVHSRKNHYSVFDGKLLILCQNVIEKYKGRFLHPNHWFIQITSVLLAQCYLAKFSIYQIQLSDAKEFLKITDYLCSIYDRILPGFFLERVECIQRSIKPRLVVLTAVMKGIERLSEDRIKTIHQDLKQFLEIQSKGNKFYSGRFSRRTCFEDSDEAKDDSNDVRRMREYLTQLEARLVQFESQRQ